MIESPLIQSENLPKSFGKCLGLTKNLGIKKIKSKRNLLTIEPHAEKILSYAKESLPQKGILKIDSSGFIFVDLPNAYIFDLYNLLQKKEADPPPYFGANKTGAHISVALSSEVKSMTHILHLNEEIDFTITGCYRIEPDNLEDISNVWFLSVESSTLETIRKNLGLSSKILNHEFHITFAMQKRFMTLNDVLVATENKSIKMGINEVRKNKLRFFKNVSLNNQ